MHISFSMAYLTITWRSTRSLNSKNLTEKKEESTVWEQPDLENDGTLLLRKAGEKNQTEDYTEYQTSHLYKNIICLINFAY